MDTVRPELHRHGPDAVLLVDPINLRFATRTRNLQVWTMHNHVRHAPAFAHGPTVLFDLAQGRHLSAGIESESEVRASVPSTACWWRTTPARWPRAGRRRSAIPGASPGARRTPSRWTGPAR